MSGPRTGLVLGGGGSKGAVQAGFLRAIEELRIDVDTIVAASVGAINGAFFAAGTPARTMAREWAKVRRKDLFGLNPRLFWKLTRASSVYTPRRLRRFLEDRLPVRRFDELSIPLVIVATDLTTGQPYFWDRGDLIEAILASTAVPGLLPPVQAPDGELLIDGALSDNVPIDTAFGRGADRVIGILCQTCAACRPGDLSLTTMLGQAFGIAVDCKWRSDARRYAEHPDVVVIEPDLGLEIQSLDFSHGEMLCREGYRRSLEMLRPLTGAGMRAKRPYRRTSSR